jgi:membrane-associated phospholipid phosphatase
LAPFRPWLAVILVCVLPGSLFAQAPAPEPAPPAEDTSFKSLFLDVPPAFLRLGRSDSLVVLATAGGVAGMLAVKDEEMTRYAADSVRFEHNLLAGHFMGDIYFQGSVALGTYIVGRSMKNHRVALLGAHLVRSHLLSGFVTDVTKLVTQRQRPNGANFSFPSGHSTSAFTTATVLQRHFGWKVGVPAYAVGTYVAVSRMADNRHYPSDLLVGAAVGIVSAQSVMVGFGRSRFAVTPLVANGGGGIAFSLVE